MMGPKAGDRVSEYVLMDVIGTGAFGQVWKARHHIWQDQLVAIKVPTDPQFVRQLQREGAAVHGLRHPNIVRAIGLDPYADPPYFVMEFVNGPSLRRYLQAVGEISVRSAREVMRGVLQALDHAHSNGVIHRDIKPENILISGASASAEVPARELSRDDVRVTDFGLGHAENVAAGSVMQSASLTGEGGHRLTGTIAYMAPEVRDGEAADARSDLFAVGIVLFEMLTGKRPSGAETPRQLRPDLPSWTDEVFSRLYTRRERRYQSASEVMAAMDTAAAPPVVRSAYAAAGLRYGAPAADRNCRNCGHRVTAEDNYCIICGHQLVTQPRRCAQCGAYPDRDDRYCILCGAALSAHAA